MAAARLYATTSPATLRGGQGIEKTGPGFLSAVHAKAILRALTGNLDVVGGDRFGGAEGPSLLVTNLEMELNEALPPAQRAKLLGADAYPLHSFAAWERMVENTSRFPKSYVSAADAAEMVAAHPHAVFSAILSDRPYPVRALICQAANPLLTLADPRRTFAALKALDLLVVMDYYMTPTAAMADDVLPAASTVERDDLAVFGTGCVAYPMGIEPLAGRRSDYELWMELGRRLGQAEHWPWDTMAEVCEHRLAPAGLDFEQLEARRAWFEPAAVGRSRELGFATASGKVELRSSVLEDLGCPPLPSIVQLEEDQRGDFPLTLITGNGFDPMYNSEQRQRQTARRAIPDPLHILHPATAAGLGLADGDWVRLETANGAVRQRLETSESIHPQTVDSQQGWWFPERQGGPEEPFGFLVSNVNTLVLDDPEHCSPGTGSWQQTGIPCRVVADLD